MEPTREDPDYYDLAVEIRGKLVLCHRTVLTRVSGVFREVCRLYPQEGIQVVVLPTYIQLQEFEVRGMSA